LRLRPLGARRADIEADLVELFAARCSDRGVKYARRRYYRDVISLWRPFAARRSGQSDSVPRHPVAEIVQDLTYALRLLRRSPGIVTVTIAGLGLAIGVSTAVFTFLNAAVFAPTGIDRPSSAVRVLRATKQGSSTSWPYSEYVQLRDGTRQAALDAFIPDTSWLSTTPDVDAAEAAQVHYVSGGYLPTFGGRPSRGRAIEPADDVIGAPPVVVLSHRFWSRRLGGDPRIVGQQVWLNGVAVTVVGVSAEKFRGFDDRSPVLWAPIATYHVVDGGRPVDRRSHIGVTVVGRLRDVGRAQAEAQLAAVAATIGLDPQGDSTPATGVRLLGAGDRLSPADAWLMALIATIVLVVIGLVLLLACVNVTNLLLASALSRRREIGVRLALGASRARLMRQLLTESLSLGLAGGALGMIFTVWFVPVIARIARVPVALDVAPDLRTLIFLTGISLIAGLGAGLAPARHAIRDDFASPLKDGGKGSESPRSLKLRSALVGIQATASVALMILAALLTRAMMRATQVDVGFDADRLLIVAPAVSRNSQDTSSASGYWPVALERIAALPGVTSLSLTSRPPFGWEGSEVTIIRSEGSRYAIYHYRTQAEYFATVGLRLVRGRLYTPAEVGEGAGVAVISESIAKDFFSGEDPIGQTLARIPGGASDTVIGIVSNAITARLRDLTGAAIYKPLADARAARMVIRTDGAPEALVPSVRNALQPLNPRIRLEIRPVSDGLQEQLAEPRTLATLAGALAGIALALAVVGIYGVTAFVVSQRTHEIGVRMALGATAGAVRTLLLRESMRPVGVGIVAGIGVALLGSRVFSGMLFGATPSDPVAYGAAALVLVVAAAIAVLIPARRATTVDPSTVLRQL
jgi:predicted permease